MADLDAFLHGPSERGTMIFSIVLYVLQDLCPLHLVGMVAHQRVNHGIHNLMLGLLQREQKNTPHFTLASMTITVSISSACQLRILPNGIFENIAGVLV